MTHNKDQNKSNAVGAFVAGAAAATAAAVAVSMTDKQNREKAKDFVDKAQNVMKDVKDTVIDTASDVKEQIEDKGMKLIDDMEQSKKDLSGKVHKTADVWNK